MKNVHEFWHNSWWLVAVHEEWKAGLYIFLIHCNLCRTQERCTCTEINVPFLPPPPPPTKPHTRIQLVDPTYQLSLPLVTNHAANPQEILTRFTPFSLSILSVPLFHFHASQKWHYPHVLVLRGGFKQSQKGGIHVLWHPDEIPCGSL